MYTFLVILHVIICLFLIIVVLLQSGKGAQIGATFGGSSQTLFGASGATTFLNKLTTAMAVLFMLTSLTLALISGKKESIILERNIKQPTKVTVPKELPTVNKSGQENKKKIEEKKQTDKSESHKKNSP
ncbi:MAG: preprotein translocase subunit SecG [Nitrospirae bacterium]|nr:MAG: preprotein translocase subunit SecG [Nitrospirota bacterium]